MQRRSSARKQPLLLAVILAASLACGEPANPKIIERYKAMLAANPAEGVALERLWQSAVEGGTTEQLLAEYQHGKNFAADMILGHLLRKAGRDEDATDAFKRAAAKDARSPLPSLALARMESDRTHPRDAADWLERAVPLLDKTDARLPEILMQLGSAWLAAGNATKAAEAWERTVALAPDDLDLRRRLASTYADNHLPEPALRHLEVIVQKAAPAERAAALQQIAKLHSAAGKNSEAIEALERAVAFTAPGNWLRAELLGQMIRLAQRQHTEGELEKKWLALVEKNPRDLGGYLQLVEFYERTGNLEQERVWLEKVTALVPKNAEHRLKLARLLVQLDQLDASATLFDQLLAEQPLNADVVFERARLDLLRDDGTAARTRIAALLAKAKGDEPLRAKALEFYQEHRLLDRVEAQLAADAVSGAEEPVFALANFYFAQRRNADGLVQVQRLVLPDASPETQAALHFRAAQLLKGQSEFAAGIVAVESAIALQPDVREHWMLLGELRAGRLDFAKAREAFERAYTLSGKGAEQIEADDRLIETFRNETPPEEENRSHRSTTAARIEGYIGELMREATKAKTAAKWLRVARWKAWNTDKASAVTFANKAAEMEPKNPAPREFLVRHAVANGDPAFALGYLRELLSLNPAGRDGYLREVGQLELQRGNMKEALAVFQQLARANPGQADALADVASALERAGQNEEAATTWRKVFALLPASRKREASAALLRVLQRLERHEEAALLLLRAVDETADEKERLSRLDELLLHAQQHGQLPLLRAKFEERRKLSADDYFTQIALGRTLKLLGEKKAAFELFVDAVFSAPNPSDALPELIREAEELRRVDAAIRLQEQLTRVVAQEKPDGFLKLASLYEKTGDLEGTERTWARATAKFPREPEVLERAAAFHRQWGDRTRMTMLLRKLSVLDPTNVRVAVELGGAEVAEGRWVEAKVAFEVVMKLTKPVAQRCFPAERGDSPWGNMGVLAEFRFSKEWSAFRVHFATGLSEMSGPPTKLVPESEARLFALRSLAEIARKQGGVVLEQWRAAWATSLESQPTETLWALYFSGASGRAVELVQAMMERESRAVFLRQAFVWMAMESGQYERLGAWLNEEGRASGDGELFGAAFKEFIHARPESVGAEMLAGLFPTGPCARLWPSALDLARDRRLPEAIALGRRAFELATTFHAAMGREVARWQLAAGLPEDARVTLRAAAWGGGDSLDSPVFEALHDLYFVTPEAGREKLAATLLSESDGATMHGLIVRALIHGLRGEEDAALGALDAILERRPLEAKSAETTNTVSREWAFFTSAAAQFIDWHLPALAERVWERAFADAGLREIQLRQKSRERVESGEKRRADLWSLRSEVGALMQRGREQWAALRYVRGGRVERAGMLVGGGLKKLGETLKGLHAMAAAAEVFEREWERNLGEPSALRNLVDAAQAAGDATLAERLRRRVLEERLNPGNDSTPRQFALELADLMEHRGAMEEVGKVVAAAVKKAPGDLELLHRAAQLQRRAGRGEDMAALTHIDGGTAYARNALAVELEQRGQFAEALAVRVRGGASGDAQVPLLFYKNGKQEESLAALEKLGGNNAVYAAMTLAEAMALRGDVKAARSILVVTAARSVEARAQMQLCSKLITIPGAPPTVEFATRMQRRMRELALREPSLAESYYSFFARYAVRLGLADAWLAEVREAWQEGRGPLAAGEVLLRVQDAAGARLTTERLLARSEMSGERMEKLAALFAEMKQSELRLLVLEAHARKSWPDGEPTLAWVRALDAVGQRETLGRYEWLGAFEGGAEPLGRAWLELGDGERARGFYRRAARDSALEPSPAVLGGLARVQIAAGKLPAARLLLGRAFAVPACREFAALIAYTEASGEGVSAFELAPVVRYEFQVALFTHYEKLGRVAEALALVAAEPGLVAPSVQQAGDAITCERIRVLARTRGDFAGASAVLAAVHLPEADAESAALAADAAEFAGDVKKAREELERAATLCPARWEFARRLAGSHRANGDAARARATLERFLDFSLAPLDREAALELLEKTGHP